MPLSNDNQDYKNEENKPSQNAAKADDGKHGASTEEQASKLTSDNLKGKKVDADVEKESDRPADV
jgi:hypothetical protein